MSHTPMTMLYDADQTGADTMDLQLSYNALITKIDQILMGARPRLLRIAQKQGVALDDAEDVVQETLIEAWKHLKHLRAPDRFDAWLNGICRNVCLRWSRAHEITAAHEISTPLPAEAQLHNDEALFLEDAADPQAIDPAEELSRQDLAALLDRAMAHVPQSNRELLELCYLADLPQREVALRLGLTISALESRLHRARRQLHQVLNGALRPEAESFGLALTLATADGEWRESREWCMICGRHHLQGLFEQASGDTFSLRMRCPGCGIVLNSGIGFLQREYRSFRPVLKQLRQIATDYYMQGFARDGWQSCITCGMPQRIEIVSDTHELLFSDPHPRKGLTLLTYCPSCQTLTDCYLAGIACYSHPRSLAFMEQHPRWITEPETYVTYQGQQVISIPMIEIASAARLTMLVHPRTLEVLATFE